MSLITELKRRNVIRVGLAYAVLSWLLLQVADVIFGVAQLPDWSLTLVAIILGLGFVPTIFFAWAFELTPEGIKREADIARSESVTHHTGRKLDVAIIALLVVAIGLFAAERLLPDAPETEASDAPSPTTGAAPAADTDAYRTSIAVLAFDNMSPDPENAFFAEGISEEILNILSRIEGLKVASRTSAFSFAGKDLPIPRIAEQLGVDHVLEGSVRKAGNRVRITAQLIDSDSDAHLWSDTYERDLTDIFRVQEEIAQAITDSMAALLGVRDVEVEAPTENLEAYQHFLEGRRLFYQRGRTLDLALDRLQSAIRLDPEFVEAWAYLAATGWVIPGYETETTTADALSLSRRAVDEALARSPDHPLALAVRSQHDTKRGDWIPGIEAGRRAAALTAHDSTPLLWHGIDLLHAGYVDEALPFLERAYRADPLVGINNGVLGVAYLAAGREAAAIDLIGFAAENGWVHGYTVWSGELLAQGRFKETFAGALPESNSDWFQNAKDIASSADPQAALEARARQLEEESNARDGAFLARRFYLLAGDADRFFARPDELVALTHQSWLRHAWQPSTSWLREDPRFFDIAIRLGLVELWEARGYPDGCVRTRTDGLEHLSCGEPPS